MRLRAKRLLHKIVGPLGELEEIFDLITSADFNLKELGRELQSPLLRLSSFKQRCYSGFDRLGADKAAFRRGGELIFRLDRARLVHAVIGSVFRVGSVAGLQLLHVFTVLFQQLG